MIRTRDFILYLLVLGFVLLGAVYTGFSDRAASELQRVFWPTTAEAPAPSAYLADREYDAAARWQELREQLAAGAGYLESAPADFTSVDQRAIAEQQVATGSLTTVVGVRSVQWCSGAAVPRRVDWPRDASVVAVEGQRVVESVETRETTVGTTTTQTNETIVHATIPVRTVRTSFDSCLPDTLIGSTAAGQPLYNQSASLFVSYSPSQVVGYTRDGFTVYGPVPDSETLDSCGGRYQNGQYQYHIRVDEPFILGCYAGVPVNI